MGAGSPPAGFLRAAPLLDALSGAAQRFSDELMWNFESATQANEVAEGLLAISQDIQNDRYQHIWTAQLEKLNRLVTMAIRRRKPVADLVDEPLTDPPDVTPAAKPAVGKRVGEPTTNPEPVDQPKPSHARPKSAGSRPSVPEHEARKRVELAERWRRAKAEGVRQKDFCSDNDVSLEYLTNCMNWLAQRRRRSNKP